MLRAGLAVGVVVTIGLAILNGCGGSSSTTFISPPPPPPSGPSVVVGATVTCSGHFFSDSTTPAVCQSATVTNCPNVSDLSFIYSYDTPASPKGTIVFLSGAGGTDDSGDADPAGFYFANGYEVIQIEWADDWEYTGGNDTNTTPANVRLAACRGATLLNFIFNTNNTTLYSGGGRCAEGSSAGSGAIAYALTFYGAGSYLDAVEMKSGPPIADFEQGCEEPAPPDVTICPAGQFGCQLGGTQPWVLSPTYTGAASGVRNWTGDSTCAVPKTTTSAASNTAWLQESIVNDGTGSPTYSYPTTAMTAWLCQSLFEGNTCMGGQGGMPQDFCPNNSTSQGQIYYAKLTSGGNLPVQSFNVYAVQDCDGPEGVAGTDPTVAAITVNGVPENGTVAIENDMLAQCVKH
ncbi:MAG: hypothetical protein WAM04_14150 [Candidatus Sulfotelmatobacter sp.]